MTAIADPKPRRAEAPEGSAPGEKGLKSGAISFASNVVIATASTAPAYSLAATLGFIVAVRGVGLAAPAVLLVSFLPMLCIAFAYNYMNRADPDAGTSFAWVTRAMGPRLGWLSGWAIVAADVIVMASLAQIAGIYSFLLVGWQAAADTAWAVTLVGCLWIVAMTWICLVGIELSALTQRFLLGAEVTILALFATVALIKGGAATPSLAWLNPLNVSSPGALADGVLLGALHLLGLGQRRRGQRGVRESRDGPGPGRGGEHHPARRHLRRRVGRGAGPWRREVPRRPPGRCAERARRQRPRLSAGQAADPGGADVRGGVDADHHPADGSHDVVDGALACDPQRVRTCEPPLADADRVDDCDGRGLARLVRAVNQLGTNVLGDSVSALGFRSRSTTA